VKIWDGLLNRSKDKFLNRTEKQNILNSKKIELLAPAGNLDAGITAINCGADAVYIGAGRFGAREKAGNPIEDIARLCLYAHKYWARVYVTLNTILTDAELPEAVRLISELHAAGIDALIIQDVGLLETDLPDIPLIASTQMHNHTPARVGFLEEIGFQRVILARELSLDQISDIRRHTSIELECFVHGALCVGYSGQCYLSYAIGGRSGNRGACAQPCRQKYTLLDGSNKPVQSDAHLLSLKDLNLSEYLNDLIEAGISSFKIEGRLKDQSYITNVVSYYRRKLDAVLNARSFRRSSSGKSIIDFLPDPFRTFNRGFTDYFIKSRTRDMAALKTPKSLGTCMGAVKKLGKDYFMLKPGAESFCAGDGICFFDSANHLKGSTVNRVEENRIFPDKTEGIAVGTIIYRNHDHRFLKALSKKRADRKIDIRLTLSETDTGLLLHARDEDGNVAQTALEVEKIPAEKKEMAMATIDKQLKKLGATDFACVKLKIETKTVYFIPARDLNEMRRSVIDRLVEIRAQNRPMAIGRIEKNTVAYPEKKLSFRGNVLNRKAAEFYRRHGVEEIEPAAESSANQNDRQNMVGKPVMVSKYCILFQLGYCRKDSKSPDLANPLTLVDEKGRRFVLKTNCKGCEMEIMMES
jgi:collagenase-like PrtC family protease